MDTVALLLKSHGPDLPYAQRLVASFRRWNAERLALHCVVPASDVALFAPLGGDGVVVHAEEEILGAHLVATGAHGLSAGYLNQEIVKLAFWETRLAANYLCVDSDAVFLRLIRVADLMRDASTPYTVLVQDKDLLAEPGYRAMHWVGRERSIRRIMELVGLDDPIMRTCHGHQVFSGAVLSSFRSDFLEPRGWTYADALREEPYEFSWYAMWLQRSGVIPIHAIEPLVKVFHTPEEHLASIVLGVTEVDLARAYLAVVVNSNYSRGLGLVSAGESKPRALAPYLSYGETAALLRAKAEGSVRRLLGRS